ncbi:MAG: 50S ribosomal protein L25 [Candidatus Acetothermia bacterium]|jgi:large subunit ribosomal protein L25|nr:50S ribosomal protein L25 [Candidatus Acetothermia bacterium]
MLVKAMRRPLNVNPKALRRQGQVPAVLYGAHVEPVHITISEKDLVNLFDHVTRSTMVEVQVDRGEAYRVFVKEIQVDPITERFLHLDLYVPEPGRSLVMQVPVKLTGTPRGLKDGGILEHVHAYIAVEAPPEKIPPSVAIDVSDLGVGDSILVKDLTWEEGVRPLLPPDNVVATVLVPRAAVAAPEAAPTPPEGGEPAA